jgi:hypothetical protein
MVRRNAVNVPMWDDWERGPLLAKAVAGTLRFQDLYAAHIQHRMVFPRLLTLGLNRLSSGDLRWEMAATYVQMSITALLAAWLVAKTLGPSAWGIAFLIVAIVMHTLQFQNLLWGIQLGFVTPALALVGCVAVWQTRLAAGWRWSVCALLAVIGNHSFSHGILIWPCVFLLFACDSRAENRTRALTSLAWGVAGAVVLALYFHNLVNTSHPIHAYGWDSEGPQVDPIAAMREHPGKLFAFFLTLLGSLWARIIPGNTVDLAQGIGVLQLLIFAAFALLALPHWRDPRRRARLLPWLALGIFAILSAAAVAAGRAGVASVSRALSPRYLGMTLYLPVACIALGALLNAFRESRSPTPARSMHLPSMCAGLLVLALAIAWVQGERLATDFSHARMQARARLALLPFIRSGQPNVSLDGSEAFLRTQADFLDAQGWLKPKILREPWLDAFRSTAPLTPGSWVGIDRVVMEGQAYRIEGRASLPGPRRPADAVVLCSKEQGRLRIVAVADPSLAKHQPLLRIDHEFSNRENWASVQPHPWIARVPADLWPSEGQPPLTAWVLDTRRWKIREIQQAMPAVTP